MANKQSSTPFIDLDVSSGTRFAEGFYNGLKLTMIHGMTAGIYYSKEESIIKGTTFRREYLKNLGRASLLYTFITSTRYNN